jgi:peptide/nickel transport system permease protein
MAMAIATVLGVGLGLAAGYYGGRFDAIVMRIADVQLALPAILTALLIDGISRGLLPPAVQQELRVAVLTLAIALSLWVNFARTARASVFVETQKDYVQAAIIMGQHPLRVMLRHILPNIMGPLLVIMTVDLASAILLEATLSFLGIGLPADSPSLGTLIRIGMQFLLSGEWWILWVPTIFLVALVVSINVLGDFLRDVFNPRLR